VSRYNVVFNARDEDGLTALFIARIDNEELDDDRLKNKHAFLVANGGIE